MRQPGPQDEPRRSPVCDQGNRPAPECTPTSPRRLKGRFSQKETSMTKSSLSDMTTKRPKEPLDPALDAPLAVTPHLLEKVAGGLALAHPRIPSAFMLPR